MMTLIEGRAAMAREARAWLAQLIEEGRRGELSAVAADLVAAIDSRK